MKLIEDMVKRKGLRIKDRGLRGIGLRIEDNKDRWREIKDRGGHINKDRGEWDCRGQSGGEFSGWHDASRGQLGD